VIGRRRWFAWGAVTYLLIMVAVSIGLSSLYRSSRDRLDTALGERLTAVAITATYLADGDSVAVWSLDPTPTLGFRWLASRLQQIRLENDLASITLCDPDQQVLISTSEHLARGEYNVFSQLNRQALALARGGFPAASPLYRTGEIYQKSAHAPVFAADGTIAGILTVEGNAEFFDSLATLRTGAVATLVTVLLFLSVLGLVLLQLNRARERYRASAHRQENLAAMGRMTAGIAHEIRNPLGIIRGAGQHLQRRLGEAGIEDDVCRFIPEEVDRLDQILSGYLAFGTDSPVPDEPCDLARIVRRCVQLLSDELAAARVEVEVAEPLPDAEIMGDPRRLQQVLINLLLNARDAMPAGGRIELALTVTAHQFTLTVADNGSGLTGQDPDKLFEPFATTKEKGSGLGLALSRNIVEDHGGTLRLRECPGRRGAEARIELPRRETNA